MKNPLLYSGILIFFHSKLEEALNAQYCYQFSSLIYPTIFIAISVLILYYLCLSISINFLSSICDFFYRGIFFTLLKYYFVFHLCSITGYIDFYSLLFSIFFFLFKKPYSSKNVLHHPFSFIFLFQLNWIITVRSYFH